MKNKTLALSPVDKALDDLQTSQHEMNASTEAICTIFPTYDLASEVLDNFYLAFLGDIDDTEQIPYFPAGLSESYFFLKHMKAHLKAMYEHNKVLEAIKKIENQLEPLTQE